MSAEPEFIQSKTLANFPFVAQIDSSDCGAACLAMVAQFFKKDLILSEARQQCGNDVSGQRICKVANRIGLKVDFVKKKFSTVLKQSLPIIAHWEGNHWIVIIGFKDGKVKIADPAAGIYWLKESEAEKAYSQYCLVISNESDNSQVSTKREHVLLKCLKPFKNALIASSAIMIIIIAVEMFIPYTFQQMIDEEIASKEESFQWLMMYAGMAAIIVIFGFALLNYILYRGAVRSENLVLDALLLKWINLPENFYKGRSFSELRIRMESAFAIKRFLVEAGGSGLFALLEIIAVFAMLEYYGMALMFAFLLLPSLILTFYTLYLSKENAGLFRFAKDSFLTKVDDITQGVFSIRAASATKKFKEVQSQVKQEMYERVYPKERKMIFCEKGALSLGVGAWILLFFQMCRKYLDNEISSGAMFAVIILAALALNALFRIISKREKYENAALIYDYLNDVLDTNDEDYEREILKGPASLKIEDKNGQFCSVGPGERLFISGDTENLIDSFRSEDSEFKVGISVNDKTYVSTKPLPQFSEMEDHAHIFSMTLLENITLGESVDKQKAKWCLRLALADHLLDDLTQGLNTRIGNSFLSDIDRQKVILARCLYRERPFYLLKNLSEFLFDSELLIFIYHLKAHMNNKTVIIEDKNLSLASACDLALIVREGIIQKCERLEQSTNVEKVFSIMYNDHLENK